MVFKILRRLKRNKPFLLALSFFIFLYFLCRYIENILHLLIKIFDLKIKLKMFISITPIYDFSIYFLIFSFVLSGMYTVYVINRIYFNNRLNKILNALLVLSTVLIIYNVLDMSARIIDLNRPGTSCGLKESNDPNLRVELTPNFGDVYFANGGGSLIEINSKGFRGMEYFIQKPLGVYRILCLGDSYTFGLGIELNNTYPKLLEERLNHNSDKSFEVLNFGVPTYNTKQELSLLKQVGFDYNPDLIILGVGTNDIIDYDKIYPFESLKRHVRDFLKKGSGIRSLILRRLDIYENDKYFKESKIKFDLESLKEIISETEKKDVGLIILLYDSIPTEELINLTNKHNITLIKMQEVYSSRGVRIEDIILSPKDGHPNELSNQIMAEELYKFLSKNGKP